MAFVRAFLRDHRRLAVLLVCLVLLMKAVVPGGYMLAPQGKVLTVTICADASGAMQTRQIVLPPDGKSARDHAGKAQDACPYAGLGMAGIAGGDIALLGPTIAFALALGFSRSCIDAPTRLFRLRPPLRGPPAPVTA